MVGTVGLEGITVLFEFEHAIAATQGARNYQEDAAAVWPDTDGSGAAGGALCPEASLLVAVLSDGMGGHIAGALASKTICTSFIDRYINGSGDPRTRLHEALHGANREITAKVEDDPELAGMGATAVGLCVGGWGAHWISVGDSPLYLYRDGELVMLNEDHSMAPIIDRMAERGEISAAEAKADGRRHFLRSAVSGSDIEMIDRSKSPLKLAVDDYLIIASDGIQTLEDDEIQRLLDRHGRGGARAVAAALISAVENEKAPYQDNATVLVVRIKTGSN